MAINNSNNNNESNNTNNNNNNPGSDPNNNNNNNQNNLTLEDVKKMVTDAVEAARKSEKDKLYEKIKGLEGDIKTLKDANKSLSDDLDSKKKELEKLDKNNNANDDSTNTNNTNNTNNNNDEGTKPAPGDSKVQELEGTVKGLTDLVRKLNDKLDQQDKDNKKSKEEEIKEYRDKQIKSKAIPEKLAKLIPSTSKKDIDEAVSSIIDEVSSVVKSVSGGKVDNKIHSGSLLTGNKRPKVTNPANPTLSNLSVTADDIAQMSNEDFVKFREENQGMFSGGQTLGYQRMVQRKQ